MSQIIKIKSIEHLTHDVLRIKAEKPTNLNYIAGQAVDIAINKAGWEDKLSAFTFTSLPEEEHIEFVVKTYPSRNGVTNELLSVHQGDELIIKDPFGDIKYKGDGIFIAGGAGVTPFIAILKDLEKQDKIGNNKLIFANKTSDDIILGDYFERLLGVNFINVLSDEKVEGHENGYVNAELIKKYSEEELNYYYLCGPKPMMNAVEEHLASLGIKEDHIVKEGF